MKAKSNLRRSKISPLPDPPLHSEDVNYPAPLITQKELLEYGNAVDYLRLAQADYEKKHGALMLKLLMNCSVESGYLDATTDKDGRLVLKDSGYPGRMNVIRS